MANVSAYKSTEKRWKRASEADADVDESLLDPQRLSTAHRARVRSVGSWTSGSGRETPILALDGFGEQHAGFFVIPGALDAKEQLQLAHACLTEYTEEPHVTNLHLQKQHVPEIWGRSCESNPDDPSKAPLLGKLHWAASGYHYNWTERKYVDDDQSPVPAQLQYLASKAAAACGMTLDAQAVIVNFYKPKSTMGGHQDDVEVTMDHPVVSVSLGSRCVFLKGGLSKDDPPLEVLLRSGDMAIFGGASRLSFHGVARVWPTPFAISAESWDEVVRITSARVDGSDAADDLRAVRTYLSSQRINVNIRQVFPTQEADESQSFRSPRHLEQQS